MQRIISLLIICYFLIITGVNSILAKEGFNSLVWTQSVSPVSIGVYYGLELADFNQDGLMDIASTKFKAGIQIWINSKNTWSLADVGLPTKGFYRDLKVADFNQDGKPDLVAVKELDSTSDCGIEIWLNNNNKWSLVKSNLSIHKSCYGLAVADLNLDGKLDIVCSTSSGIEAWIQEAVSQTGDITNWESFNLGLPSYEYYHGIAVGDFNLDGKPDIVVANKSQSGIGVWLGDGKGNWQPSSKGLFTARNYYGVDIGDVNQDGFPDIIAAGGGINVWIGDGQGNWKFFLPSLDSNMNYYGAVFADLNLDGKLDIAATSNDNQGIRVWLGSGNSRIATTIACNGLPKNGYYHSIKIGIENSLPYLVAAGDTGIQIYTLTPGPTIVLGWVGQVGYTTDGLGQEHGKSDSSVFTYRVNYINLKGLPPQKGYPKVIIYKGAKTVGTFTMKREKRSNFYSYSTHLKETGEDYTYRFEAIDTEGNTAVGSPVYFQPGPIVTKEPISPQEWAQKTIPKTSYNHYNLAVGDINNDGKLDAVIATPQGIKALTGETSLIEIAQQDSTSLRHDTCKWTPADSGLPQLGFYYGICLVDFNLDGNLDLIATKKEGIEAWLGDGDGRWTRSNSRAALTDNSQTASSTNGLPTTGFYYGIIAGDFNQDGLPDIVAGTNDQKGVKAWIGKGSTSGSYNEQDNWIPALNGLSTEGHFCSVALLDINSDGKMDIVAGDFNGIRHLLCDSPLKLNLLESDRGATLLLEPSFQLFGLPDLLFGRFDGITACWTGDGKGNWKYSFTNLSVIQNKY